VIHQGELHLRDVDDLLQLAAPQEWSDLPAPYKYLGVKLNPADVTGPSPLWSALSDWRLAVPIAALCAMPLYITGNFPGIDERLELSFITILAATVILREAHPIVENMVKAPIQARVS
jgi:hypothetical protein